MQLLAAGGVVLTVGMLAYFFFILRDCWLFSRDGNILARYLMISIATWLVLGIVENEMIDRQLYFTVGCVAALAATTIFPRHSLRFHPGITHNISSRHSSDPQTGVR
jgi:hypothetical protein